MLKRGSYNSDKILSAPTMEEWQGLFCMQRNTYDFSSKVVIFVASSVPKARMVLYSYTPQRRPRQKDDTHNLNFQLLRDDHRGSSEDQRRQFVREASQINCQLGVDAARSEEVLSAYIGYSL